MVKVEVCTSNLIACIHASDGVNAQSTLLTDDIEETIFGFMATSSDRSILISFLWKKKKMATLYDCVTKLNLSHGY